ncbi:Protein GrpE [Buchnera aphidicola (Eriosoma lanigerum)]|uniref:nucleotide exchange factor GrpE n=1 Tax=Buchnera aphidicola TaxID=9 RepID=UPI003464452A
MNKKIEKDNKKNILNDKNQILEKNILNPEVQKESKYTFTEEINILRNNIKDMQLRTQAQIENMKKNSVIEINQIKSHSIKQFVKKLLPIIDKIEHAVNLNKIHTTNQNDIEEKGLSLILKCILDTMSKYGLRIEGFVQQIFNPKFHETQSIIPNNTQYTYYIQSIKTTGYIFNNEILRKAIVTITKNKDN